MLENLEKMFDESLATIGQHLPNLAAALAILLVGGLAVWILSLVVRSALRRLRLSRRLAKVLDTDAAAPAEVEEEPLEWERWASRVVFWIGMVFVLIGFFQALKLTMITTPLNEFLGRIAAYAPRVIGALVLLLVAWVVAFMVKKLVAGGFRLVRPESKLATRLSLNPENTKSLARTVSEASYWLVLLLFLPAVLSSLAIEGLLGPVENLTSTVVGFLPNLLAAAAILLGGWLVARVVRGIITGVAAALGADTLGARVGLEAVGTQKLSQLVGTVVYILILIPVFVASLNALQLEAITAPASNMLDAILSALPALLSASLILVIAFVVGRVIAGFVSNLLTGIGFDSLLPRLGLGKAPEEGERTLSDVAGLLIVVGIMLFASMEAARQLGFENVATLLMQFTVFAGKGVLAVVIFAVGLFLGNLAANAVRASKTTHAPLLAQVARLAIVVLATTVGLQHLGVGEDIIELAFGILLGSIAIAGAIAFGIGGREQAGAALKRWLASVDPEK